MTAHISEVDVSLNKAEEQSLRGRGFKQVLANLNKGAGGSEIYLWYKTGPKAITRIQVSFNKAMAAGMINAGYKMINKDLNTGAGGNKIYLWSYQGTGEYDTPIKAIDVTTDEHNEAAKFAFGWQRQACDLNRGAKGGRIHIWVQREKKTFICDIAATDSYGADVDLYENGYIRVDEDTNVVAAGGSSVFIWYRQSIDTKGAITDVQVAVGEEEAKAFQSQEYTIVNTNLNEGTSGDPVYLFYKKVESDSPIKAIALLGHKSLVKDYEKAGLSVIEKSLNSGNDGLLEYLCLFQ